MTDEATKRRHYAVKLFAATHSKVDDNGQRIWCNVYAKSVYVRIAAIVCFKVRRMKCAHKLFISVISLSCDAGKI